MKIGKEEVIRINKAFGGSLRNDSSLIYALDKQEDKKIGEYKKLAYLLRAVLVDHPFSDGNKRTAAYMAIKFAGEHKKGLDRDLLVDQIISIAKNNINDIRKIERRMKNVIR